MESEQYAKIDVNEYSEQRMSSRDRIRDDIGIRDDDQSTSTNCEGIAIAPYSILPSDDDRETIINDALDELAVIARENILEFKREEFNDAEVVGTWVDSYLCQYFSEVTGNGTGSIPHRSNYSTSTEAEANALNDVLDAYILELYDEILERFYEEIAPPRVSTTIQSTTADAATDPDAIRKMTEKIQTLREKPQPDQRTPEWYTRRNNLITASAASKAFGSQASVNQLIYEKCKNYTAPAAAITANDYDDDDEDNDGNRRSKSFTTTTTSSSAPVTGPLQGSVNSPLHWGQRYEPLTVQVYERRNRTKLGEFGCIQHDTYPFIGASPDGINIDPASPIYGRMVEIKNIVNREITGRPKEEYWIQTQIQMEVCDLDECDFVETRFKEYESEEDYHNDVSVDRGKTTKGNEKGIILWFQSAPTLTQQGSVSPPIQLYEYAPIGATTEEYDTWEAEVFAKHERSRNIWVRTIYWYLDEYSCVLIRRNRLWFAEAAPVLQRVWSTIEGERQTGFEHRAPMKRKPVAASAALSASTTPSASANNNANQEYFKLVKLDTAIVPETITTPENQVEPSIATTNEVTATNMAILMSLYNNKNNSKKSNNNVKRPSDVLINCFKIDELEMDETKVE